MLIGVLVKRVYGLRTWFGFILVLWFRVYMVSKLGVCGFWVLAETGILQQVQGFRTFAFSHIKRQGNFPAHVLAQHACNIDEDVIWLEECPSQIETACAQDVCGSNIHE
ncbi:hypothetical protein SO802_004789 [Lithocarpus litseifolius]|uniref:RNase H type-1 domain-containing protein n=1 Tax=Lithocarpus litseifolius TaxID=425828 RepID=A0AAW2DLV9_9ROSI